MRSNEFLTFTVELNQIEEVSVLLLTHRMQTRFATSVSRFDSAQLQKLESDENVARPGFKKKTQRATGKVFFSDGGWRRDARAGREAQG